MTYISKPLNAVEAIGGKEMNRLGYEITYPSGYKTWLPKEVFEDNYKEG